MMEQLLDHILEKMHDGSDVGIIVFVGTGVVGLSVELALEQVRVTIGVGFGVGTWRITIINVSFCTSKYFCL